MLDLLWGILNIVALISFFFGCFKTTKHLYRRFGSAASLLFVVVILSFVSATDKKERVARVESVPLGSTGENNQNTYLEHVTLEKNLVAQINLDVTFSQARQTGKLVPLSGWVHYAGFVSGKKWRTSEIIVNTSADSKGFVYKVYGKMEWRLLWLSLYSETKTFEGTFIPRLAASR
jgi:hypothetical protein